MAGNCSRIQTITPEDALEYSVEARGIYLKRKEDVKDEKRLSKDSW